MRQRFTVFLVSLLLGGSCERAPRPDPGRWDKVKAEEVPPGVADPIVLETVKFDVGMPESPPPSAPIERRPLDPRPVEVDYGRCGEPSRAQPDEGVQMRASAVEGGKLTLRVQNFRSYCSPKPAFGAGLDEEGVVVAEIPPPEGTPIARCTCLHDFTLEVRDVPPGQHEVRLFSRLAGDGDPVPEVKSSVLVPG